MGAYVQEFGAHQHMGIKNTALQGGNYFKYAADTFGKLQWRPEEDKDSGVNCGFTDRIGRTSRFESRNNFFSNDRYREAHIGYLRRSSETIILNGELVREGNRDLERVETDIKISLFNGSLTGKKFNLFPQSMRQFF